jgi:hypothetical protein
MFCETWIIGCYEILRAFQQRDREAAAAGRPTSGVSELDECKSIFTDFELLRMPIAKFELAKDNKLKQPLPMRRVSVTTKLNRLSSMILKTPADSISCPKGSRRVAAWLALDIRNSQQHWVERRALADRLLSLLKSVKGAGELEAEQNAAVQALAQLDR